MTNTTTGTSSARKTWVAILIAFGVIALTCMVAVVAGGIYVTHRYVTASFVGPQDARGDFERTRAKLGNEAALIDVRGRELIVHRTPDQPVRDLGSLHVLAYDPAAGKLMTLTVPGWVLSIAGRHRSSFGVEGIDVMKRLEGHVTLEDLQRHGPGLILDTADADGRRVLVWTE
jgi:hypothetical protein